MRLFPYGGGLAYPLLVKAWVHIHFILTSEIQHEENTTRFYPY